MTPLEEVANFMAMLDGYADKSILGEAVDPAIRELYMTKAKFQVNLIRSVASEVVVESFRVMLDTRPVEFLSLSERTLALLRRHGVKTAGHLIGMSEEELRGLPGVGSKTIEEIQKAVHPDTLRVSRYT